MERLKGIVHILMDSPFYFLRSLDERMDHAKELLEREEVINLSRTDKDLTATAAEDQKLYRETTGQPAAKRYKAKKRERLDAYSRKTRRGNKVRGY